MDPRNTNDINEYSDLRDEQEDEYSQKDRIFLIDGMLNLFKINVERECEVLRREELSKLPLLKSTLEAKVRGKDFIRMSISERCLCINESVFNINTGFHWDFNLDNLFHKHHSENKIQMLVNLPFSHL